MKRISAEAYQALREALAVIVWNKRPFESYLRAALRDSPELLAGLPFAEPKRVVADILVDRLLQDERRYQDVTLNLMLEIASMTSFPNIELIKDKEDRAVRLEGAQRAVAHLRNLVRGYAQLASDREKSSPSGRPAEHKTKLSGRSLTNSTNYVGGFLACRKNRTRSAAGATLRRSSPTYSCSLTWSPGSPTTLTANRSMAL